MNILIATMILAGGLLFVGDALAEGGCPPGQYPQSGQGWQTCVPIPGYEQPGASNAHPPVRWEDRYGAVVADASKGVLGSSKEMSTQDRAIRDATSDCREKGGESCQLQIAYGNKCVALATGENLYNVETGTTPADAQKNAMNGCHDDGCHVFYAACSLPVRVQ